MFFLPFAALNKLIVLMNESGRRVTLTNSYSFTTYTMGAPGLVAE